MSGSKKKPVEKSAAVLTIFDAANFSDEGVKAICKWLDQQKKWLRKHRTELSPRFTARYRYIKKG
jgi:hypothetical protein